MSGARLDEVKAAWARVYAGLSQEEINQRVRGFAALVRGIAKTGAVTPDDFRRQTGLNAVEVSARFSGFTCPGHHPTVPSGSRAAPPRIRKSVDR